MEARDHVTRLQGRLLSRDQSRLDDGLMSFSIIVLGFGPGLSLLCSSLRLVLWVIFVAAVFLTSDDALLRAAKGGSEPWIALHWNLPQLAAHRILQLQRLRQVPYHIVSAYLGGVLSHMSNANSALAALFRHVYRCGGMTRSTRGTTPPTITARTSRLGPKSQGRCRVLRLNLLVWSFILTGTAQCASAADARVSGPPTGSLGASASAGAKYCGLSGGILGASDLPAARKRSFKRALQRFTEGEFSLLLGLNIDMSRSQSQFHTKVSAHRGNRPLSAEPARTASN